MHPKSRIAVLGARGMVGSALVRRLQRDDFAGLLAPKRSELDLCDPVAVEHWFAQERPEYLFHAAGLVGGIGANAARPADFLYENMMMHATVLQCARRYSVTKLLYLGSSCIYPRECPQPIREEYLMAGPLEKTNAGYAIAKIAGLMSCQAYRDQYGCNFISAMPTNLYGPNDNFDLESSHVLPGLIAKFERARCEGQPRVTLWGTGTPRREFLHVDDLADACLFLMERYDQRDAINVGSGREVTIAELADIVRSVVYPSAEIAYDAAKPDGTPRKLLDTGRLQALGWQPKVSLEQGIEETYAWFRENVDALRSARSG